MYKALRKFGVGNPDDYWVQRRAQSRASEGRLHRFLNELVDELFPRGARVLDCGAGSGHLFRLCRQKHETHGVEFSAEAIAMCDCPTDNILQADLNDGIPEFGMKFDVVVASMVLHWLNEPLEFLEQAKNILSVAGRLIVAIPNITFYRYRLAYLLGRFPPISCSHKNFQVPAEITQMFRQAGFEIERRLTPKKSIEAKLWPTLFASNIVYVLRAI